MCVRNWASALGTSTPPSHEPRQGRQKFLLEVGSAAPDGTPEDCGRSHPGLTPLGYESAALRARDEAPCLSSMSARTTNPPVWCSRPPGPIWITSWRRPGAAGGGVPGRISTARAALPTEGFELFTTRMASWVLFAILAKCTCGAPAKAEEPVKPRSGMSTSALPLRTRELKLNSILPDSRQSFASFSGISSAKRKYDTRRKILELGQVVKGKPQGLNFCANWTKIEIAYAWTWIIVTVHNFPKDFGSHKGIICRSKGPVSLIFCA
jgi:hypothetical protein